MSDVVFLKLTDAEARQLYNGYAPHVDGDGYLLHSWIREHFCTASDKPTHYFFSDPGSDRYESILANDVESLNDKIARDALRFYATEMRKDADRLLGLCTAIDYGLQ